MTLEIILQHANKIMRDLGVGHKEGIYARAFNVALNKHNIPHRSEVDIPIMYEGECIGHGRADLIVNDLIIEMKAVSKPPTEAMGQLQKYVTNLSTVERKKYKGVIINFSQSTGLVSMFLYNEGKTNGIKSICNKPMPVRVTKRSKFFKK